MEYLRLNKMKISRITIGTAQLGTNYGIANEKGKPSREESLRILKESQKLGINSFDTAPSYGSSESIIGDHLQKQGFTDQVITTKLSSITKNRIVNKKNLYENIKQELKSSLIFLKLDQIPILLLHDPNDMNIYNQGVLDVLEQTKDEGLIKLLGVSVYSPTEIKSAMKLKSIQVIQAPVNIFDQRATEKSILNSIKNRGILFFSRSIFLQGLFFLNPKNLPKSLEKAKNPLESLQQIAIQNDLSLQELCISFVRDIKEISSLVIGIDSIEQLKINVETFNSTKISTQILKELKMVFSELPEEIINPSKWNLN